MTGAARVVRSALGVALLAVAACSVDGRNLDATTFTPIARSDGAPAGSAGDTANAGGALNDPLLGPGGTPSDAGDTSNPPDGPRAGAAPSSRRD